MIINLKKKFGLLPIKEWLDLPLLEYLKKKNIRYISTDRKQLNLIDQNKVFNWVKKNKPNIFLTSAKVN